MHSPGAMIVEWVGRKYKADPETGGIVRGPKGEVLNEEIWHDPNIDDDSNFNVVLDQGRALIFTTIFSLSGSGYFISMCPGSGNISPAHDDLHLTYEFPNERKALTNSDGSSPLTAGKVVSSSPYSDNNYSPAYQYYYLAQVQGSWNGNSDLNAPYQEFAINTSLSSPASPTSGSGTYFDHYLFGSATDLEPGDVLLVTANIRM